MTTINFMSDNNLEDQNIQLELLSDIGWNLEIYQVKGVWYLKNGEVTILKTRSKKLLDYFVAGMTIVTAHLQYESLFIEKEFHMQVLGDE